MDSGFALVEVEIPGRQRIDAQFWAQAIPETGDFIAVPGETAANGSHNVFRVKHRYLSPAGTDNVKPTILLIAEPWGTEEDGPALRLVR